MLPKLERSYLKETEERFLPSQTKSTEIPQVEYAFSHLKHPCHWIRLAKCTLLYHILFCFSFYVSNHSCYNLPMCMLMCNWLRLVRCTQVSLYLETYTVILVMIIIT